MFLDQPLNIFNKLLLYSHQLLNQGTIGGTIRFDRMFKEQLVRQYPQRIDDLLDNVGRGKIFPVFYGVQVIGRNIDYFGEFKLAYPPFFAKKPEIPDKQLLKTGHISR